MRFIRTKAALVGASLAFTLAACGDAGNDDEGSDVGADTDAASSLEDGTRMKEIADAGTIKVGVKYDQPGLGFKDAASDIPSGFDVEVAKILVVQARHRPRVRQGGVGRDRLGQPRALPRVRQGRPRARVVLHHRRAAPARRPDRALHGDRPAGAGEVRQRRHGHRRPQGQGGLLGDRVDLDRQDQRGGREGRRLRQLLRVRPEGARRRRRGHVDRRHDPGRASPPRTRAS